MHSSAPAPGLIGSLRILGAGLVAGVQERVELVALELQDEKFRLIQSFVWIGAAMFTSAMALTFASLALVYLFWDAARLAVLVGLAAVYAIAAVATIVAFRRYLARQPRPFAATIEELKEDGACIRREH